MATAIAPLVYSGVLFFKKDKEQSFFLTIKTSLPKLVALNLVKEELPTFGLVSAFGFRVFDTFSRRYLVEPSRLKVYGWKGDLVLNQTDSLEAGVGELELKPFFMVSVFIGVL